MAIEVIDLGKHEKVREREVFPVEENANEYIYKKGWYGRPNVLKRERKDLDCFYSVVTTGNPNKEEVRVAKNLTKEEAKKMAEGKADREVMLNTPEVAMMPSEKRT